MKIVGLAGGLSTERMVSLVTGTSVCRALRENGHRAILVDLFLGLEETPENLETLFDAPDGLCPEAEIKVQAPDIDAVRRSRKDQSRRLFGPHVLELCGLADIVFLGLHGQDGEDGRVQATFDLLGVPYTGGGYLASGLAMDKAMTKRMMDSAGILLPGCLPAGGPGGAEGRAASGAGVPRPGAGGGADFRPGADGGCPGRPGVARCGDPACRKGF